MAQKKRYSKSPFLRAFGVYASSCGGDACGDVSCVSYGSRFCSSGLRWPVVYVAFPFSLPFPSFSVVFVPSPRRLDVLMRY
jgi:hypothetical protein